MIGELFFFHVGRHHEGYYCRRCCIPAKERFYGNVFLLLCPVCPNAEYGSRSEYDPRDEPSERNSYDYI